MTTAKQRYVVVGAGNLAYHLAKVLTRLKKTEVIVCHHHSTPLLQKIKKESRLQIFTSFEQLPEQADVYFLCVSDNAIKNLAQNISAHVKKGVICHCSGSTALDVLKNTKLPYGVFYPLQSFSVNRKLDWITIPLLVEASHKTALKKLEALAKQISDTVVMADSEKRKYFHLAAVLANNFTNALLLAASHQITQKEFELLKPILKETIDKAFTIGPEAAQTGPAKRGDKTILSTHLKMLSSQKDVSAVYSALSTFISNYYKDKTL